MRKYENQKENRIQEVYCNGCGKKLLTDGKSACKVHNGIKDETGRFDVGAWVLSL